jgi:hypothetical protein
MWNRWLGILAIGAIAAGYSLTATAAPPDVDHVPLTLSGCVVAGESKDSYLLTNVVIDGTTMAPPHAFYRFSTTKGLTENVGRRVEVRGKADLDDVDAGKLRVKADDGKVRTEISSERRTVKVENAWFGSIGSIKTETDVPTYKFEVQDVKRLEGNCSNSAAAQ